MSSGQASTKLNFPGANESRGNLLKKIIFQTNSHKGISMLVDYFLSLWFRGLINLGEYSKGKATQNRALAVYKSGVSIEPLFICFGDG